MKANEFQLRNQLLKKIGFPDYQAYLQSEMWASIRSRVLSKRRKCATCRDRATLVHHDRYTIYNMTGKNLAFLRPLCHDCHELVHFDGDKFVDLEETRERFDMFKAANRAKDSDPAPPKETKEAVEPASEES